MSACSIIGAGSTSGQAEPGQPLTASQPAMARIRRFVAIAITRRLQNCSTAANKFGPYPCRKSVEASKDWYGAGLDISLLKAWRLPLNISCRVTSGSLSKLDEEGPANADGTK